MAIQNVVIPADLGQTIKPNAITANKYDINLDGDSLTVDANGVIALNPTSTVLETAVKTLETTTSLTYDPVTKIFTYINEELVLTTFDLSALAIDLFVSGGSYDATTGILTLTDASGTTPDITINLGDLKQVAKEDSDTVTITGTGETSSPLKAEVKIDSITTNLISSSVDGVAVLPESVTDLATVELQGAFGTHVGYIFP